jgi:hypothetical protein
MRMVILLTQMRKCPLINPVKTLFGSNLSGSSYKKDGTWLAVILYSSAPALTICLTLEGVIRNKVMRDWGLTQRDPYRMPRCIVPG